MTTPTKAKTKAQLQAEYDKAWAAYEKVVAAARAEYDEVVAPALAKYEKSVAAGRAKYNKAQTALDNYQPKKKLK